MVALFSVAGALVGHWLGRRFGRPLLYRYVSESKVLATERLFNRYGSWAILVAAFTPLPYKVFAISAGVLDLDRRTFIIASLVGRGARFVTLGVLVYLFGEEIQDFISANFGVITVAVGGAVIAAVVALAYAHRRGLGGTSRLPAEATPTGSEDEA